MDGIMETFEYVGILMPSLLAGTWETVKLFVVTLLLSLPLGLPFALGGNSRFRILRAISKTYIWIFRGTPLLLQLFFFYYFLPIWFGEAFRFDVFTTAAFTFILNYAAYFAEIFRGGLLSIDKGQYEAAKVLGMNRWQTTTKIILPQMFRIALPAVANESVTLVKDTALLYAVAVPELLHFAQTAVNRDFTIVPFFIAGIIYLLITLVLTLLFKALERKFKFE